MVGLWLWNNWVCILYHPLTFWLPGSSLLHLQLGVHVSLTRAHTCTCDLQVLSALVHVSTSVWVWESCRERECWTKHTTDYCSSFTCCVRWSNSLLFLFTSSFITSRSFPSSALNTTDSISHNWTHSLSLSDTVSLFSVSQPLLPMREVWVRQPELGLTYS